MFGSLGVPELLLIFAVILIVFGPRKIPEIGRTLGKAMGEFRKATDELKNTIEREVRLEELKNIAPAIDFTTPFEAVSRSEPHVPGGGVVSPVAGALAEVDESSSRPVVEEQDQPQSWPDGRTLEDASVVPDVAGQSYPVLSVDQAGRGDGATHRALDAVPLGDLDGMVPDVDGQSYPVVPVAGHPLDDSKTRPLDDSYTGGSGDGDSGARESPAGKA